MRLCRNSFITVISNSPQAVINLKVLDFTLNKDLSLRSRWHLFSTAKPSLHRSEDFFQFHAAQVGFPFILCFSRKNLLFEGYFRLKNSSAVPAMSKTFAPTAQVTNNPMRREPGGEAVRSAIMPVKQAMGSSRTAAVALSRAGENRKKKPRLEPIRQIIVSFTASEPQQYRGSALATGPVRRLIRQGRCHGACQLAGQDKGKHVHRKTVECSCLAVIAEHGKHETHAQHLQDFACAPVGKPHRREAVHPQKTQRYNNKGQCKCALKQRCQSKADHRIKNNDCEYCR